MTTRETAFLELLHCLKRDFSDTAGALDRVIARNGGLSFFTDEQIEAITAEMVRKERWSHSLMIRNRRAYWAAKVESAA